MSMESRVDKYSSNNEPSRTSRNARLYKEVYGKYDELNNLPIEDNTDEIDMNRLQELLHGKERSFKDNTERDYQTSVQKKRNIDEKRIYDINKILEKAKYENNKLKETSSMPKVDTSILSTLQSRNVMIDEIENESLEKEKKRDVEDDLSMTRELKFKSLSDKMDNPLIEHVMPDNDLSLDLFENLRPTDNTITTKPIRENLENVKHPKKESVSIEKIDVHSGDTRDIDIIRTKDIGKDISNKDNGSGDFFTSSYEFSVNDFLDSDEKKGNVFKIILLFLAIVVFSGVIAYFVINYGLGA